MYRHNVSISATVPPGTLGRVRSIVCLPGGPGGPGGLYSLILKGPSLPVTNYLCGPEALFLTLFCIIFQNLFFRTIGAKSPRNGSPERTKITKIS